MWNSNHHYSLLQQGAENYEDSEESEVSSQGTESFKEETEHLEPWSRIFDEAEKRHETQLNSFRKRGSYLSREHSSSCLQKRAEKSILSESIVNACHQKRPRLQKSNGNPKRA